MRLSKSLAAKLLQLAKGERVPASKLNHSLIAELIEDGIIAESRSGRLKSVLYIPHKDSLNAFLFNRFSITDLEIYIDTLSRDDLSRALMVQSAADSKVKRIRTFKGFLVNSYEPITASLSQQQMIIHPPEGTFQFIHDFERFVPDTNVTIIGVENSENFSQIHKQQYLFRNIRPLFVSRYPQGQSKDLIKWLQTIPNPYLHFGDFDFAGIDIYLNEYKRYLEGRSTFFVPEDLESLLTLYGSKRLYDTQRVNSVDQIEEIPVLQLIKLMHKYKKGLEQESLIMVRNT